MRTLISRSKIINLFIDFFVFRRTRVQHVLILQVDQRR